MAVLSLLIERPSYVYDVAQRYHERFGDHSPRSDASVYRVVDQLSAKGLLEPIAAGSDGPRRTHYRVTRDGARAYSAWMAAEIAGEPARLELVTRMLAAASAQGAAQLLDVLDSLERECLAEATRLPPTPHPEASGDQDGDVLADVRRLVAEERRLAIGTHLRWIRYARSEIQAGAARTGPAQAT